MPSLPTGSHSVMFGAPIPSYFMPVIDFFLFQVCGEEGQVEVVLCNPLAVPVKVESISLHARYQPPPLQFHGYVKHSDASSSVTASSAEVPGFISPPSSDVQLPAPSASHVAHHHHHHPSGTAFWRPNLTGPLVLPPGGKPLRMVLSGSPLLPGTLTLTGLRVAAAGGVQWFQPFHTLRPDGAGADHRKVRSHFVFCACHDGNLSA